MLLWTGLLNSRNPVVLVGGVMASALFMDAANGAAVRIQGLSTILRADEKTPRMASTQYSLVPHVNPQYNGIMSGLVGATGNMGGVLFSVGYRFTKYVAVRHKIEAASDSTSSDSYHKGTWILGVVAIAIGVLMTIVKPIPKKQLLAGGYMSQ